MKEQTLLEAAKWAVMEWRLHGQLTDSCRHLEAAIDKTEGDAQATSQSPTTNASPFDEETQAIQAARHERLGQHPGYLNGYDRVTEADQHHAYMVGFSDAIRAGDAPVASQSPAPPDHQLRCRGTGNPCGTDTWQAGHECDCGPCQAWLTAFHAPVAAAHSPPRAQDWQPIEKLIATWRAKETTAYDLRDSKERLDASRHRLEAHGNTLGLCAAELAALLPPPAEGVTDPARETTPDQILAHGRRDADRLGLDTLPIGGPVTD